MVSPMIWREHHPRCEFCEYYKSVIPVSVPGLVMRDFFECIVKKKTIKYSKMPRPWCQCFKVKLEREFKNQLTTNEGN